MDKPSNTVYYKEMLFVNIIQKSQIKTDEQKELLLELMLDGKVEILSNDYQVTTTHNIYKKLRG